MPTSTANFRDFYKPGLFVGVSRFIYFIESTKIRGRITQRSNSERRQKRDLHRREKQATGLDLARVRARSMLPGKVIVSHGHE